MKKLFGNREFYKLVLALALPLLLQNAVSTFVNLLDNLMVGRVGTESMSGVSIVNQLIFVYNLCLFGGSGGAGIFGAQFFGKGDQQGVGNTLRFNLVLCVGFSLLSFILLTLLQEPMIGAFLHDSDASGSLELTLSEGKDYLRVMRWGLPAFAVTTAYVSILRVTKDNRLPMRASVTAILVNLVFNYLLIYGKLGFPCLGVRGAAIATVMSRYVEMGILLVGTHSKKNPREFARGLYRHFRIPKRLTGQIIRKGMPLLVNEMFWSLGMTMLTQCYSYRGLDAVAALNINNTVLNFFNTILFTMGNVCGVILGNMLGAEEYDRARSACPRIITVSVLSCMVMGGGLIDVAPLAPQLYNTSPSVMYIASCLMRVCGFMLPVHAVVNCSYWAMRAGGKTIITMLFDSVYTWVFSVPAAFCLLRFTALDLVTAYTIVNLVDFIKCTAGIILLRKGIWVQNIINAPEKEEALC